MSEIKIPGKVMLSGEYAVLYGGTAVLVPVPRFLKVSESNKQLHEDYSPVVKEALSLDIPELFDVEKNDYLKYIDIDRSEFFTKESSGSTIKLGIGSSAAEAVGVIALRFERTGIPWREHLSKIVGYAMTAHRNAQGGKGSGADVAVCAYGKPIRFKSTDHGFKIKNMIIDEHYNKIPMALVHSGVSANTRDFLNAFEAWVNKGENRTKALISELVDHSNTLAETWFSFTQDMLINHLDNFIDTMKLCAKAAGINYETPVHNELEDWAIKNNGRAKPTGAGGGDMILLIGELPLKELHRPIIAL